MEKQTVFRKVSVKERLPSESGIYLTNKCTLHFISGCKRFMGNDPQWWLEEIELPSDEDIQLRSKLQHSEQRSDGFVFGANYILNKIK